MFKKAPGKSMDIKPMWAKQPTKGLSRGENQQHSSIGCGWQKCPPLAMSELQGGWWAERSKLGDINGTQACPVLPLPRAGQTKRAARAAGS